MKKVIAVLVTTGAQLREAIREFEESTDVLPKYLVKAMQTAQLSDNKK